jgi:sugar phosphate isomerase/epimerase
MATIAELIQAAQDKLAVVIAADPAVYVTYRIGNKTVEKSDYVEWLLRLIERLNVAGLADADFDTAQFDLCTGQAGQDCTEYLL